jgi:hypothetical protein
MKFQEKINKFIKIIRGWPKLIGMGGNRKHTLFCWPKVWVSAGAEGERH